MIRVASHVSNGRTQVESVRIDIANCSEIIIRLCPNASSLSETCSTVPYRSTFAVFHVARTERYLSHGRIFETIKSLEYWFICVTVCVCEAASILLNAVLLLETFYPSSSRQSRVSSRHRRESPKTRRFRSRLLRKLID